MARCVRRCRRQSVVVIRALKTEKSYRHLLESRCRLPISPACHDKFKDRGLVVIGVHSPQFGHERVLKNVRNYVHQTQIFNTR